MTLAGTAPSSSAVLQVHSLMDSLHIPPNEGLCFQILQLSFPGPGTGLPRPEPWRSCRDLILQRVPAVVTSPNCASPQSKHCKPPIPSHSRISQLVPPEYGGNLGRGKIGTQTGVIFALPSARAHTGTAMWPRADSKCSKTVEVRC